MMRAELQHFGGFNSEAKTGVFLFHGKADSITNILSPSIGPHIAPRALE
jgi:hypothetical protein